jgi:flagellar biogenesis protein FliO
VSATQAQQVDAAEIAPAKLALHPPKKNASVGAGNAAMPSVSTMLGSLAIVVGLFLLVAWTLRRGMPRQTPLLPQGILEVLGRAPLVGKQQVHLVRLGNKLLLLAITPAGIETLTEVTDPVEIDRLAGICQQGGAHSSTKAFNQLLGEFSDPQPAKRGSFSKPEPDFSGLAAAHSSGGNRERRHA